MKQLALGIVLGLAPVFLQGFLQGPDKPQGKAPPPPASRPAPPPPGKPLPPVDEPWRAEMDRSDIVQRFQPDDPWMGFYELRARVINGSPIGEPGRGWLVLGRRHLMICLDGPGEDPGIPLFRAGVRRYVRSGGVMTLHVLAGHFNLANGDVKIETQGLEETRQVEMVGGRLRVMQGENEWLEFARIE